MDDEEAKRASMSVPFTQLGQDQSDLALAMLLQEQEQAIATLMMSQSDNDEDNEEDNGSDIDCDYDGADDDGEFIVGDENNDEFQYLEEENSDSDEEMEEDENDSEELSYEDLIALGEIVGEESRGLSADAISISLRPSMYKCQIDCECALDRCVICQVEYEEGEQLVVLHCEHPYHSNCISQWLQIKKNCPICGSEVSPPAIAKTT